MSSVFSHTGSYTYSKHTSIGANYHMDWFTFICLGEQNTQHLVSIEIIEIKLIKVKF